MCHTTIAACPKSLSRPYCAWRPPPYVQSWHSHRTLSASLHRRSVADTCEPACGGRSSVLHEPNTRQTPCGYALCHDRNEKLQIPTFGRFDLESRDICRPRCCTTR